MAQVELKVGVEHALVSRVDARSHPDETVASRGFATAAAERERFALGSVEDRAPGEVGMDAPEDRQRPQGEGSGIGLFSGCFARLEGQASADPSRDFQWPSGVLCAPDGGRAHLGTRRPGRRQSLTEPDSIGKTWWRRRGTAVGNPWRTRRPAPEFPPRNELSWGNGEDQHGEGDSSLGHYSLLRPVSRPSCVHCAEADLYLDPMSKKRRLPVVGPTSDLAPPFPGYWAIVTGVVAFTAWLPLSLAAAWLIQAWLPPGEAAGALPAAGLAALGISLGAFLVAVVFAAAITRGAAGASSRDAVAGGTLAGLVGCGVAGVAGALQSWTVAGVSVLVLGMTGALGGALGGSLGRRWAGRGPDRVDPTQARD